MPHASDSTAQSDAEPLILAAVAEQVGVTLEPRRLTLPGGATADVDGVAPDESVLVEVFARQGALKGRQRGKIAPRQAQADHPRSAPPRRPADPRAGLRGRRQAPEGQELAGRSPRHVPNRGCWSSTSPVVRAAIRAAQVRQVMVNAAPPPKAGAGIG